MSLERFLARKIGGDDPEVAEAVIDAQAVRQRQERLDRLTRMLMDVPPPEGFTEDISAQGRTDGSK